jgi:hypothetical protein
MSSLSFPVVDTSDFLSVSWENKKAALLKHVAGSERLAIVRPASQLEVRPRPEMLSTGVHQLDALMGGIPRGCLSEICGPASSGKTSVLLATLTAASAQQETCALLDSSDSFDPASAQAAGLDFQKLLWVRCGVWSLDFEQKEAERKDQPTIAASACSRTKKPPCSELRLEQVIKTTDLLLQSGGFGLIVLDLAGIPEKFVRRIPLASWFRFQRVVEHTKTALLVISEVACAETCATLVVKLAARAQMAFPPGLFAQAEPTKCACVFGREPTHARLLEGMRVQATMVRSRLERKPAQSVKTGFRTQAIRLG